MSEANISPKSKFTAFILAIFLGWLGIHNFYMGYVVRGVMQLIKNEVQPIQLT